MKRYAVLFGILAVVLACGTSYANAPQVGDVPDLKLRSGDGSSSLPLNAMDAYDVMDYFRDVDDTTCTVSIRNVSMLLGSSIPTIDIDGATEVVGAVIDASAVEVDVYGHADAAWAQYTVRVDGGTTKGAGGADAISDVAIAKYSTFALNEPTIEDGVLLRTGGETASTRQFVYCWVEPASGQLYQLDVAIDPQSASASVDWEVWVSDVIYCPTAEGNWDANGSWLGLVKQHATSGADCNHEGLYYSIDANGQLTLTSGGSVSPGPWLVGIMATNQSDPNDSDGSRILVANALLPEASPDTATIGGTVTLDDLTPGTIAEAADVYIDTTNTPSRGSTPYVGGVAPVPINNIAPGCGWNYMMSGTDTVLDSVVLEIVDLSADTELPVAAQIGENAGTAHIAGGNALKASLPPVTGIVGPRGLNDGKVQLPGFRLVSRAYTGLQTCDILTMALSVATDAVNATDLPKYQIYLGSGFAGTLVGKDIRRIPSILSAVDGADFTHPQTDVPTAAQGWKTLSVTYGVGASVQWFNVDGDTDFDAADRAILDTITFAEGWAGSNELSVAKGGFQCSTTAAAQNTVNIWLDNLRVYRSAYALDLALGPEELTTAMQSGDSSALDTLVGFGSVLEFTSGNLDGTIEAAASSSHADLSAIGLTDGYGAGGEGAFSYADKQFINGDNSLITIGSHDHTRNAGSDQSLRVALAGDDGLDGWSGALDAIRSQIATTTVAGSGDGLYAIEAYVAKLNECNLVNSYRHPQVRVIVQEMGPNYVGTAAGYICTLGGLPEAVTGDPPYNWMRQVADLYIPNCDMLRGIIQIMDTFKGDVTNFDVPIYIDDLKLYKIDDPATFFDADLFDGV